MAEPGSGDITPRQGFLEADTPPISELLHVMYGAVGHIRDIEDGFQELADVQQALVEGAVDVDQAASFFESANQGAQHEDFQEQLEKSLSLRDIRLMASIGYASVLIAAQDALIQKESDKWADSPEAQAFVGAEVALVEHGHGQFGREDTTAYMVRDGLAIALWDPNWITGRITKVSSKNYGTIILENGVSYSEDRHGERLEGPYQEGEVSYIFVRKEGGNLLPSANVIPTSQLEGEKLLAAER